MALRAFHSNPAIGGFGNETETNPFHEESGDAFAQIVKELVDNAVDACSTGTGTTTHPHGAKDTSASASRDGKRVLNKRVRVSVERVESKHDGSVEASTSTGSNDDDGQQVKRCDLLRLTICDNGCGMKDIETCVSAFSSSKIDGGNEDVNRNKNRGRRQPQAPDASPKETAGRYGIGLTLCLLHAQRLVPNSCAMIKSTVRDSSSWTVAKFVVDTNRDSVVCVQKKVLLKKDKEMSGTAVSLLLPGGTEAKRAWPRLAEYFARFQLSLGLKCSLEVLAPSLSRLPLFIRPTYEVENMERWKEQNHTQNADASKENSQLVDCNEQGEDDKDTTIEETDTPAIEAQGRHCDAFIDLLEEANNCIDSEHNDEQRPEATKAQQNFDQCTNDDDEHEGWHLELDEDFFSSTNGGPHQRKTKPHVAPTTTATRSQKREDEASKRRIQIQKSISSYLKKPINLMNVAHSHQRIRRSGTDNNKTPHTNDSPSLEVDIIVSECDENDYEVENSGENLPQDATDTSASHPDFDRSKAKIMLIRMVNRIPMLDGAEASACGVVRGLQQKSLWNSFGLDISPMCSLSPTASVQQALHVPTFSLADSAHVAPFFSRNSTHELFSDDELSDDESECELDDVEDMLNNGLNVAGKRKRNRKSLLLKPAGLRLGNILVIVRLNSKSSQLPLPTLSKGRLPMNDSAINTALQAGLNSCLRSLQKTNPSLLLTSSQLKKTEREVLYIPSIASALSSLILNCKNDSLREDWLSNFQSEGGCSTGNEAETQSPTQSQLTHCLEDRIREALLYHEEERKREAIEKQKSRRKSKSAKNEHDDSESLSMSSSQYDLENFMNHEDEKTLDREAKENLSLPKGADTDVDQSDDDMKSTLSCRSSVSRPAEAEVTNSSTPNEGNANDDDEGVDQSDDDMKSTFSCQSSVSRPAEIEVTNSSTCNECDANDNDFDDDEWW